MELLYFILLIMMTINIHLIFGYLIVLHLNIRSLLLLMKKKNFIWLNNDTLLFPSGRDEKLEEKLNQVNIGQFITPLIFMVEKLKNI